MRTCSIDECHRKHKAYGLCSMHYRRKLNNGITDRPRDGKNCAVDDCERKCTKKLYCDKHYYRYRKYGDPLKVKERYQKKDYSCHELFEASYRLNEDSGCWEWIGGKNYWGYGRLNYNSKHLSAHRYAFEYFKGAIGDGMYVCHHCDNPSCVNPEHLFLGDSQTNIDDMVNKGRHVGCRKLNESHVREIKNLLKTDLTQFQIAQMYKVSRSAISNIAYSQTWRNIK